jgi:hypothetical protein
MNVTTAPFRTDLWDRTGTRAVVTGLHSRQLMNALQDGGDPGPESVPGIFPPGGAVAGPEPTRWPTVLRATGVSSMCHPLVLASRAFRIDARRTSGPLRNLRLTKGPGWGRRHLDDVHERFGLGCWGGAQVLWPL